MSFFLREGPLTPFLPWHKYKQLPDKTQRKTSKQVERQPWGGGPALTVKTFFLTAFRCLSGLVWLGGAVSCL